MVRLLAARSLAGSALMMVFAALTLGGCGSSTNLANGVAPCTADTDCPASYHCATTQTCWRDGQDPQGDGGPDGACPTGFASCGGSCVDTLGDNGNCGGCGNQCKGGTACSAGTCGTTCGGKSTLCGGADGGAPYCADLSSDGANCGTCGKACGAGLVCAAGTCAVSCPSTQVNCGGTCVDPTTDAKHCGATAGCGTSGGASGASCATGQVCNAGTCAVSCPGTQLNCAGTCVDPVTDRKFCGASADCTGANAGASCAVGEVCNGGTCSVSCPGSQVNCGGVCVDPTSDRTHCGATAGCGTSGGAAGASCAAGQVCNAGACSVSCPGSQVNCCGVCVDPSSDRGHCGATLGCGVGGGGAGTSCASGQVCNASACSVSCPGSQINCGGVCVEPMLDRGHCGATSGCGASGGSGGAACASGQVCNAGACSVSCPGSQVNCSGICVDPATNRAHCGASAGCGVSGGTAGTSCASGQVCNAGACSVSCPGSQVNCSGACVNLQTDSLHCGNCTTSCGSGKTCVAGVCSANCSSGQTACGGVCTNTSFDPANCGGCATACTTPAHALTSYCSMNACGFVCAAGYGDCNGSAADGCETSTLADAANCGACGNACTGGATCVSGACVATPTPTFLWLDANDASSLTLGAGNVVNLWKDKTGLGGRDASPNPQAPVWTPGVTPNGGPAVYFNPTQQRLVTPAVTTASEMTIFVVFNMVNPQTWACLFEQTHDTYFSIRKSDCCGGNGNLNFHIQNDNTAPLIPITTNTWQIVTALRQGSTSTISYRGGPSASFSGDTLNGGQSAPLYIGSSAANESSGAYIAEIRAYASALSAGQRSAIEDALAAKYVLPKPPPAVPTTGLLTRWKLDDASGVTASDASGNGRAAALSNATWQTTNCKLGACVELSGAGGSGGSYLSYAANLPVGTPGTGFTYAAWVYLTSPTTSAYQSLYNAPWTSCCTVRLLVDPGLHPFWDAGSYSDQSFGGYTFPTAQWLHVTWTISAGGQATLYVNGVQVAQTSAGVPGALVDQSSIDVGAADGFQWPLKGRLNDVLLYNRALAGAEVASLYQSY